MINPERMSQDPFTPPNPDQARAHRVYAALAHIAERHAATQDQRDRQIHPQVVGAHEAVRLVSFLAAGTTRHDDGEPEVDQTDITAALTLIPLARAEMDQMEASLLLMARGRGLTWQEIAFGLGLGSAQAAQQRYERLAGRVEASQA
ncbi:DNA-binding protein [Microtetraspora malaysiensis]|uniref:DNA-binding protein n=1 Tax=Microtetraspora malaysiensis TaxID=161358 RepID=UPI00082B6E41|nr:DNA-binding protein [Microtetraspora malaysiensis]